MDLRVFYEKLRKIESAIAEAFVVVISRETPDGGKPGIKTEVPRRLAAQLIAEDKAEMASAEEAEGFRVEREARWRESLSPAALLELEAKAAKSVRKNQKK